MSLVDYGSDSSESGSESSPLTSTNGGPIPKPPSTTSASRHSLFNTLPAPKGASTANSSETSKPNSQLKRKKIFVVDLPKSTEDSDSDSEDHAAKKVKPATSGKTGLFSFLPPPKHAKPSLRREISDSSPNMSAEPWQTNEEETQSSSKPVVTKLTGLVPHSLTKKKAENKFAKDKGKDKLTANDETVEDNVDAPVSFFTLDTAVPPSSTISDSITLPAKTSTSISTTPDVEIPEDEGSTFTAAGPPMAADSTTQNYDYQDYYNQYYQQYYQQYGYDYNGYPAEEQSPSTDAPMDEKMLRRLAGKNAAAASSLSNIKEISRTDQLHMSAWEQANTSAPIPQGSSNIKFSSVHKRKHNLMFLAAQAREREHELQEKYARGKQSKKISATKYGF
ncbi:mitotic checkpoint regulator, MAD2B-interacting-domain-containing protein [Paraphysoderma sedebokerense]|nr:mitotic checkpoint regulator, MAD2B-interacting-domain-containing protein [Paraphysoderma sedebokerense]